MSAERALSPAEKQPMKIVHVETGRHFYGGAQQVIYLMQGLRERGVEGLLLRLFLQEYKAAAFFASSNKSS